MIIDTIRGYQGASGWFTYINDFTRKSDITDLQQGAYGGGGVAAQTDVVNNDTTDDTTYDCRGGVVKLLSGTAQHSILQAFTPEFIHLFTGDVAGRSSSTYANGRKIFVAARIALDDATNAGFTIGLAGYKGSDIGPTTTGYDDVGLVAFEKPGTTSVVISYADAPANRAAYSSISSVHTATTDWVEYGLELTTDYSVSGRLNILPYVNGSIVASASNTVTGAPARGKALALCVAIQAATAAQRYMLVDYLAVAMQD